MDNGFPQNSVKDIIKDKYGFIWIATENSILQYDGQKIEIHNEFNMSDAHFGNFHGSVEKDSIVLFNIEQQKQILLKRRRLLMPGSHLGIREYIENGKIHVEFNKNAIGGYYGNNLNYFINVGKDKYTFADKNKIIYTKNNFKKILNITYENVSNIFVKNDVLFVRNIKKEKIYVIKQGIVISKLVVPQLLNMEAKIYWQGMTNQSFIVNNKKLYSISYDGKEIILKHIFTYDDTNDNFVYSIFYDKDSGKLFLGSLSDGLKIITLSNFVDINRLNSRWHDVVYASLPFSDNSIVTPQGIEIDKNGKISDHEFSKNFPPDKFLMLFDDHNNIVLSSANNLVRIYKKDNYIKGRVIKDFGNYSIEKILKSGGLYGVILKDIYNYYYLNIYKNHNFKEIVRSYVFKFRINSCVIVDNNYMLIGTDYGLYKGGVINNKIEKLSHNLNIKNILKNKDNTYWVTTKNEGFFLLKYFKLFPIPLDENKYLLSAHSILEDFKGNLWISSNNGLFKVSKKEILESTKNKLLKPHYYRYSTQNGLLNNEFNGGGEPNAYVLNNNDFVFPSMKGFVIFNPDSIKSYYPKKNIMIVERVRVDNGNIIFFNDRIKVKSDFKHIEIFSDIPYYSNNENLHIEFKFNDGPWQRVINKKIDIFSLEPANYKLIFKVFLGPEVGYREKIIYLEIMPFIYQTKVFYFFCFVLLVLVVFFIIRLLTRKLFRNNMSLKRKLADSDTQLFFEITYQKKVMKTISHDITTPLMFISTMLQKIKDLDNVDLQKQYIEGMYKSSKELYKFTQNLEDYSNLFRASVNLHNQEYLLFQIVQEKKELFQELANQNSTTIINNISCDYKVRFNKAILTVILHNILDNAVKHTLNGTIEIGKVDGNKKFKIIIKDTGIGMSTEQINYYNGLFSIIKNDVAIAENIGFGLQLVIQLLRKCNSEIYFKKNSPNGTWVCIILNKY
ncbi:sensor histidine kinase [Elizabethkingia anophelis]|uniref:sensor histidine kinase n=1 Tax=Elizabethkingia anophelis TaxID=1117645 RepID=UPI00136C0B49|nr:HAMP domain-containing sensor histidine kinase [Elizabethkingia anophelis]MYY27366.1 sensor histidine kinase [Elizabethkingia anophelis]